MTTINKPHTINELIQTIYQDNSEHLDFMDSMASGDCDCHIHTTLSTIVKYGEE